MREEWCVHVVRVAQGRQVVIKRLASVVISRVGVR